jgi:hypothetical protein
MYSILKNVYIPSVHKYTNKPAHIIIVNDGAVEGDRSVLENVEAKCKTLHHDKNHGPAFSKWKFIEHVQMYTEQFDKNNIVLIVDGDDYLCSKDVFTIINQKYVDEKCWMTYVSMTGKFSNSVRDINRNIEDAHYRHKKWRFAHPRSFKLFLMIHFTEMDFKESVYPYPWFTKCTDCPLIYNILEWCGTRHIGYIDTILYMYREHANNSYKTISQIVKARQLQDIVSRPIKHQFVETIHIVMCCWKRVSFLHDQLESLSNQTYAKRIHLHLLNNNTLVKEQLELIVTTNNHSLKNISFTIFIFERCSYTYF